MMAKVVQRVVDMKVLCKFRLVACVHCILQRQKVFVNHLKSRECTVPVMKTIDNDYQRMATCQALYWKYFPITDI